MAKKGSIKRPKRRPVKKRPAGEPGIAKVVELLESIHIELCEIVDRLDKLEDVAREAEQDRMVRDQRKR